LTPHIALGIVIAELDSKIIYDWQNCVFIHSNFWSWL